MYIQLLGESFESMAYTKRDCVLMAMRRQAPPEVPFEFALTPLLRKQFSEKHGTVDYQAYYGMATRRVSAATSQSKHDYSSYYRQPLPPGTSFSEWGVARIPGSIAHFVHMEHPMANMESPAEIEAYPFPDLDAQFHFTGMSDQIERVKESGYAAVAHMEMTIFEAAWYLRSMDQLLVDMYTDSAMASVLLDRITALRVAQAAGYARDGVDIIRLGDDVGTQKAMLMDPKMWRKLLKPRLAQVITAAKSVNPQVLMFYHSDGNILPIIPELIEIGVDILNPIQPECMDPAKLKQAYGDKLSFWGTIGTQTTMPFGTPDDVRNEVRERIATVGKGGGLFLAPSHILEPEVPWVNIEAFVEAVCKYGSTCW
jgi:uroporphyrinogen decarboxylase